MTILLYVTKLGRGNVRPQSAYRASATPSLLPTYHTLVSSAFSPLPLLHLTTPPALFDSVRTTQGALMVYSFDISLVS